MKRLWIWIVTAALAGGRAAAAQPAGAQGDYVPASTLPPVETLPAAPIVIAAYAFVWVALIGYVWSVWRRLQKVEDDIARLERGAAER